MCPGALLRLLSKPVAPSNSAVRFCHGWKECGGFTFPLLLELWQVAASEVWLRRFSSYEIIRTRNSEVRRIIEASRFQLLRCVTGIVFSSFQVCSDAC